MTFHFHPHMSTPVYLSNYIMCIYSMQSYIILLNEAKIQESYNAFFWFHPVEKC